MNERPLELRIVQILVLISGLIATLLGGIFFVFGQQAVNTAQSAFDALTGQVTGVYTITPTVDSEIRFYVVFWISYGVVAIQVARTITERLKLVPLLTGIFFAGAVGRVLSYLFVGAPHPMFTALMLAELIYPPLVVVPYLRLKNRLLIP